ncbi:MAG: GIY-YIG nuclease family protein [Methanoregula sp.]|jgi:Uri superfamily endonuclease|uniref:GIY-YIG nuclease family protein n=1 Tax=Methanoregula sp. TaxID=2052170 RepID=UPI0025EB4591|nr:GIY-YIG nuclease family protein [Methanoregula sp.]MCK9631549.1 GIY-YIG nuclease family protein [Methanoregula sp.]
MDKGCYCLVFENPACTVGIGALGPVRFPAGWHVYVGSALGSGGLARLDRHVRLSGSKDKKPKWHVDYLSVSDRFTLRHTIHTVTDEPLECRLADALGPPFVPSFGCSDCHCPSHLFYRKTDPHDEIIAAINRLGHVAITKTMMNR